MQHQFQSQIQWISISVADSEKIISFCRQVIFSSVLSTALRQASLLDKPLQFETGRKQTANLFAQNDCKHTSKHVLKKQKNL